MSINYSQLSVQLSKVSRELGYDPDNNASVIYDVVRCLERGDLATARLYVFNEADKITNERLRRWIVDKIFVGQNDHPWKFLWRMREKSKSAPDT